MILSKKQKVCSVGAWNVRLRRVADNWGDIYSQFADLFKELSEMSQEERPHKAYFEGLETPFETSQRAEGLAKDVFREAKDGETVLFVTHSNLI